MGKIRIWCLTGMLLLGMTGLAWAKRCEELGKQGPNWVTIDGTWALVDGIDHIPEFPALHNNVIRIRPNTTMYGLEGWHVSMLNVTLNSAILPPDPGASLTEKGFATFVGVLGKVTPNDPPVIEPGDILAEGAFLATFQKETIEFRESDLVIDGEIHYSKGTLGFEGMHGTLTFGLNPSSPDDGGLWVGCFHLP